MSHAASLRVGSKGQADLLAPPSILLPRSWVLTSSVSRTQKCQEGMWQGRQLSQRGEDTYKLFTSVSGLSPACMDFTGRRSGSARRALAQRTQHRLENFLSKLDANHTWRNQWQPRACCVSTLRPLQFHLALAVSLWLLGHQPILRAPIPNT